VKEGFITCPWRKGEAGILLISNASYTIIACSTAALRAPAAVFVGIIRDFATPRAAPDLSLQIFPVRKCGGLADQIACIIDDVPDNRLGN